MSSFLIWRRQNRHALTTGTIWQADAIIRMAGLLLKQRNSPEARVALARGIADCARAIEAHETPTAGVQNTRGGEQ
jgi:hypothetical protein